MRLITLGFGVLFSVAACGGSTDEGLSGTGGKTGTGGAAGSGASAGSGGVAGAAGAPSGGAGGAAGGGGGTNTGGSAGYTLENVCDKTQPQGCEWAKACCTQSGFGYDQAGCVKNALGDCQQNVADVKAGKMKFDPSQIDTCLSAYKKLLTQCTIKMEDFLSSLDALKACGWAFEGKVPTGGACTRDAECAPSADPNVFVGCDDDTKKCTASKRLPVGANCAIGEGVADFCAPGLYCDAAWSPTPPYPGVCKTATPEGKKCNGFKPYNLECGAGFYCNKSTSLCTQAKAGGASCGETIECQSYACDFGKCKPVEPVVDQATCTG